MEEQIILALKLQQITQAPDRKVYQSSTSLVRSRLGRTLSQRGEKGSLPYRKHGVEVGLILPDQTRDRGPTATWSIPSLRWTSVTGILVASAGMVGRTEEAILTEATHRWLRESVELQCRVGNHPEPPRHQLQQTLSEFWRNMLGEKWLFPANASQ